MTDYLTLSEAAEKLGCSRWTLYRAANSGKLRTVRVGNRHKTTELWINDYLNRDCDYSRTPKPKARKPKRRVARPSGGYVSETFRRMAAKGLI